MNVIPTRLAGVVVIEPRAFADDRGYFFETWHQARYAEAGLPSGFVQDNVSFSAHGVIRGLHLQWPAVQAKLISVLAGEIFDVAVDVRVGSPTFGQWVGETLSAENRRQMYVPEGFAHGFAVTGPSATVLYKCTDLYTPSDEKTVLWDDPAIGVAWPVASPILSLKDRQGLRLADMPQDGLPPYREG